MHTVTWSCPDVPIPRVAVLQMTGYNAYMGRSHDYLANRMVDMGIRVYGLDIPGFGRSAAPHTCEIRPDERSFSGTCVRRRLRRSLCNYERRGYVSCFHSLVDDLHDYIEYIHHDLAALTATSGDSDEDGTSTPTTPSTNGTSPLSSPRGAVSPKHTIPLFILGESMGGALTLEVVRTARPRSVEGIILMAPMCGIDASLTPHPMIQAIGKALALVAPWFPAPVADFSDLAMRDKENFQAPKGDPLKHQGRVMIGTGLQLQAAAAHIGRLAEAGEYAHIPMLICHGTSDVIVPFLFSQKLVQGNEDKAKQLGVLNNNSPNTLHKFRDEDDTPLIDTTLVAYQDAWHVLFGETEDTREQLIRDIIGWILGRVPKDTPQELVEKTNRKTDSPPTLNREEEDDPEAIYRSGTYISPMYPGEGQNIWKPIRRTVRPFGKGAFAPVVLNRELREETLEPLLLS